MKFNQEELDTFIGGLLQRSHKHKAHQLKMALQKRIARRKRRRL